MCIVFELNIIFGIFFGMFDFCYSLGEFLDCCYDRFGDFI